MQKSYRFLLSALILGSLFLGACTAGVPAGGSGGVEGSNSNDSNVNTNGDDGNLNDNGNEMPIPMPTRTTGWMMTARSSASWKPSLTIPSPSEA
jgi:hypothetical protein